MRILFPLCLLIVFTQPGELVTLGVQQSFAFRPQVFQDTGGNVNLHRKCPEARCPQQFHIVGLDDLRTYLLESQLTLVQENLNLLYLTGERYFGLEGVERVLPQFFDFFFFPHIIQLFQCNCHTSHRHGAPSIRRRLYPRSAI